MNNRGYIGIDINEEYVDLCNRRVKNVVPYTDEQPNPKNTFIISKEQIKCAQYCNMRI